MKQNQHHGLIQHLKRLEQKGTFLSVWFIVKVIFILGNYFRQMETDYNVYVCIRSQCKMYFFLWVEVKKKKFKSHCSKRKEMAMFLFNKLVSLLALFIQRQCYCFWEGRLNSQYPCPWVMSKLFMYYFRSWCTLSILTQISSEQRCKKH